MKEYDRRKENKKTGRPRKINRYTKELCDSFKLKKLLSINEKKEE